MPLRMRLIEDSKQRNPTGSAVTGWGRALSKKSKSLPAISNPSKRRSTAHEIVMPRFPAYEPQRQMRCSTAFQKEHGNGIPPERSGH